MADAAALARARHGKLRRPFGINVHRDVVPGLTGCDAAGLGLVVTDRPGARQDLIRVGRTP